MSQKEINTINRNIVAAGAEWMRLGVIPSRFSNDVMRAPPFGVGLNKTRIMTRARTLYNAKRTGPGAPSLSDFFAHYFEKWDPWGKAPPPMHLVMARNSELLRSGKGGFRRSRDERWTRAQAEYRKFAKNKTREYIAKHVDRLAPMTLYGVLSSVAATGRVKARATKTKAMASLTVPRKDRQNKVVQRAFSMLLERERMEIGRVMERALAEQIEGKGSVYDKGVALQRKLMKQAAKESERLFRRLALNSAIRSVYRTAQRSIAA